jgi:hypothetical protein
MQAEIMSIENAEKLAKYDELVLENERLKSDNAKLQEKYNLIYQENQINIIRTKDREKNYIKTNALKDKRIRELEEQLYLKKQGSLFK